MKKGFTLIELVMVIVILGILAATALPRFVDLSDNAKKAAAKGALGALRAAVAIEYARNASGTTGAVFPTLIQGTMFANDAVPLEPLSNSNFVTIVNTYPATSAPGWAYNSVTGDVWINNPAYTSY